MTRNQAHVDQFSLDRFLHAPDVLTPFHQLDSDDLGGPLIHCLEDVPIGTGAQLLQLRVRSEKWEVGSERVVRGGVERGLVVTLGETFQRTISNLALISESFMVEMILNTAASGAFVCSRVAQVNRKLSKIPVV